MQPPLPTMLSTLSSPPPPPPPPSPPSSLPHHLLKLSTSSSSSFSSSSSSAPSWFVLLRSYAHSPDPGHKRRSLLLFRRVLLLHLPLSSSSSSSSASPNSRALRFSFPLALKSCAFLSALPEGSQLHALLTKLGLAPADTFVANSLVHFYASCALLPLARQVFDRIPAPDRSRVSWNAIVDACVANAAHDAALALFRAMQRAGHAPDAFALQSALGACAAAGALSLGMWSHALLLRTPALASAPAPVACDVLINNSLVDLYAKCGAVDMARQVFDEMPQRDAASWNVLILGLAAHGRVAEALAAFAAMSGSAARPNAITFVGVLSACNHGGLVDEGLRYFDLMVTQFRIEPQLEHYGCVVDLLARAGRVDAALRVVAAMPRRPDAVIWRSLLDACAKTNAADLRLTESLAERALQFRDDDPAASGAYVLLSRIYASAQRWNDVAVIRRIMTEHGVRKEPGFSSVEADDGAVHQFVAGDTSHPRSADVYKMLDEIERKLEPVGYERDCSQAAMVAGTDGAKGDSLRLHSEKLAIAFALLCRRGCSSSPAGGAPIRILKNLRVCRDCHTMSKLISRVYSVEIIVRDRIRFHHFKDGSCSCMDYW